MIAEHFQPGCICVVRRRKRDGLGMHFGVLMPDLSVVDFNADTGVRHTDSGTFAEGLDVEIVRVVDPGRSTLVHQRVFQALVGPPRYDVFQMNCEKFANWITGDEARSDQVLALAVLAACGFVLAAFAR